MVKGELVTDLTVACLLSIHLLKLQEANEAELPSPMLIVFADLCSGQKYCCVMLSLPSQL